MRKIGTILAVLGLAVLGLAAPATSVQAAAQGPGCAAKWPGRDGYVRAWDGYDCSGTLLGATTGDDPNWSDGAGAFADDGDRASSVMNSGFVGGKDVVAFYFYDGYQAEKGYTCLAPGELYADNLSDNTFALNHAVTVDNHIFSHVWVAGSACAGDSWLT